RQGGLNPALAERVVELDGLAGRGAPVKRTGGLQGRGGDPAGEHQRAAVKELAAAAARIVGQEQRVEVREVGRVVLGVQGGARLQRAGRPRAAVRRRSPTRK